MANKKFDTQVQLLKYKVLKEVSALSFSDELLENIIDIPEKIIPGRKATTRCCVYKERAIVNERVKLALGGNKANPNVIEVINIACDECPVVGYEITQACRGCLAHRCQQACPKDAIYFDHNHHAHIDKSRCIECGACASVCPYTAIINLKKPCQNACKVKAISMDENKAAVIDNSKCTSCGACVYQCPFGAIMDKSYILNVIDLIKKSEGNSKYKVYAMVAPSISSQFSYAKIEQVVSGIKKLGFYSIIEAALGADMTSLEESKELVEKGILTSSCCPAFVTMIKQNFPKISDKISETPSPMAILGSYLKKNEPGCKVVFIGPCTAKKMEALQPEVRPFVDSVITFEELQAMFDSRNIELDQLEEEFLDNASYYGRIFARTGGLSEAISEALKEQNLDSFDFKPVQADGIDECKKVAFLLSRNLLKGNYIEGMACNGGCINGAGCLTHGVKNKAGIDRYGREAFEKKITDATFIL